MSFYHLIKMHALYWHTSMQCVQLMFGDSWSSIFWRAASAVRLFYVFTVFLKGFAPDIGFLMVFIIIKIEKQKGAVDNEK